VAIKSVVMCGQTDTWHLRDRLKSSTEDNAANMLPGDTGTGDEAKSQITVQIFTLIR